MKTENDGRDERRKDERKEETKEKWRKIISSIWRKFIEEKEVRNHEKNSKKEMKNKFYDGRIFWRMKK